MILIQPPLCLLYYLFKGEGGGVYKGCNSHRPSGGGGGGSPLNQFKALTKICTSFHISMDQITINIQNLSMLYMNVS